MGLFDKLKKTFKKEENKLDKKEVKLYDEGLSKTRDNFVSKLVNLTNKHHKITEDFFMELEEILVMADLGVNTVMKFMDRLRDRVKNEHIENTEDLKEIIVDELFIIYVNNEVLVNKINYASNGPTVILFVGVNGVGKTTTIAKIASKEIKKGKKVLMVGADTFRAGAVKQLKEWAEKTGSSFVGDENIKDPSAVVYDGLKKAKEENFDIVLIDTAGRLQNKVNLMKELEKINRVISNFIKEEVTNITGIVLTKLDGTAKGGIVLAIKDEIGLPVKYVGLGEKEEDLSVFDIEKYIYGLFKDMIK